MSMVEYEKRVFLFIRGRESGMEFVFGRLSIVEDHEKALEISRRISLKFTQDQEYIDNEILHFGDAVLCFSLTPEHICGKKVKES